MSLLSDIESIATPQRGPRCTVARIKATHPDIVEELEQALGNLGYTGDAIAAALKKRNIQVSGTTLNRHRGGRCQCP